MIRDVLDDLFSKKFLDDHLDEWGIVEHCDHPTSLGYSTTITPKTIYEAVDRSVDVIVTHHDAWKFMFEQRDEVWVVGCDYLSPTGQSRMSSSEE